MRTRRSHHCTLMIAALFALLCTLHSSARAGEVQVAAGLAGAATSWPADGSASGSLRIGYRFRDLAGIYFLTRLGYGAIDERMLISISAGAQIWGRIKTLRPFFRFGLLHNHEEPWPAVQNEPAGALLGVGDGIRHRTGVEAGVGLDIPLMHRPRIEVIASIEATTSWLTYSVGPSWYWGGGFAIGLNYAM